MTEPFVLTASCVLYNTAPEEVARLIAQTASIPVPTPLYLIDNSPEPVALPLTDPTCVTVIRPGANLGYGRANNLAIRDSAGRSRYHLVVNSDLQFAGPDVARLIAFMDERPDVGLVLPRVEYPDGRLQTLCRLLPTPVDLLARRTFVDTRWAQRRNQRYEFTDWSYDRIASFPFLSGCFMLMRQEVLQKVGGFDERYFLYGEDMDLSRRMHQVSETLFFPGVKIVHEFRSRAQPSRKLLQYLIVNVGRYFNKWGWIRDPERDAINRRCLEQFPDLIAQRRNR